MNRDDILRMAREAGFDNWAIYGRIESKDSCLARFAALVAAAEREACAKLCEEDAIYYEGDLLDLATHCAAAIRARGKE